MMELISMQMPSKCLQNMMASLVGTRHSVGKRCIDNYTVS